MNADDDPVRLSLESSGSSQVLRRALEAARSDLPPDEHVERMLARFPLPANGDPGGGGAGDAGGGSAAGGPGPVPPDALGAGASAEQGLGAAGAVGAGAAGAKLAGAGASKLLALLAFGALGAGALVVASGEREPAGAMSSTAPASSPPMTSITMSAASAVASPGLDGLATASADVSSSTSKTLAPPRASPATSARASASADAPVRAEMDILRDAQAAKHSSPSQALVFVNEHARSHPRGALGQEREMIRIESLLALGRRPEAQALADAFRRANPGSAYARRLDAIIPAASP